MGSPQPTAMPMQFTTESTALAQAQGIVNPVNEPLEIVEVQFGAYLGADDIVRLSDDCARV